MNIGDWVKHDRLNIVARIVKDTVLSKSYPTRGKPTGLMLAEDYAGRKYFVNPSEKVWSLADAEKENA